MQIEVTTKNYFPSCDELMAWELKLIDNGIVLAEANLYDTRHLVHSPYDMIDILYDEDYSTSCVSHTVLKALDELDKGTLEDYSYFILDEIKVNPRYRGKGVGTAFMKMTMKFCWSQPFESLGEEVLIGFRVSDFENTKKPTKKLHNFYKKFTNNFVISEYQEDNQISRDKLLVGMIFINYDYAIELDNYDIEFDDELQGKISKVHEELGCYL